MNQIIAFILLLCFAVAIVPLNMVHDHSHDHSEKAHCDINDEVHSDDACHFSLYHNQLEEKHCTHKAHFSENEMECELCKMLNSQRDDHAFLKEESKFANRNLSVLVAITYTHHSQTHADLYYNKGPPCIV